jgi:hypothetical protein
LVRFVCKSCGFWEDEAGFFFISQRLYNTSSKSETFGARDEAFYEANPAFHYKFFKTIGFSISLKSFRWSLFKNNKNTTLLSKAFHCNLG